MIARTKDSHLRKRRQQKRLCGIGQGGSCRPVNPAVVLAEPVRKCARGRHRTSRPQEPAVGRAGKSASSAPLIFRGVAGALPSAEGVAGDSVAAPAQGKAFPQNRGADYVNPQALMVEACFSSYDLKAMTKDADAKPPTRKALVRDFASGKLIGTLFGKYSRNWGREAKIVEAIATAHNDHEIDVLSIVTGPALEAVKRHDFFQGQGLYCKLIPKLECDARKVIDTVECLIRAAGNDGAAGLPGNALAEWFEADQARSKEMLELVDSGDSVARGFIPLSVSKAAPEVRAGLLDHLHATARNVDDPARCNAIFGVGQIDPATDIEWVQLLATLGVGAVDAEDIVRAAMVAAAARRLRADAGMHAAAVEDAIAQAVDTECGERLLHQCANALWLDGEHCSAELRSTLLNVMLDVNPANGGTIDHLDHALADLVRRGNGSVAADFLMELLPRHQGILKLKHFDSTCHAVHEREPSLLNDWVVNWLLDGRFELCRHLSGALFESQMNERVLHIDFARYGLKERDYPYLARKAIGYLFLQPLTVASIIVSLVRSAPKATRQEIEELLFDPMLLNYGGFAKELLVPISTDKSDQARGAARKALARIKDYLAALNAARAISELRPSERQRQIEWQRNSDAMAEAHRHAEKKSVFADIFTKVVVLYGNRSISYIRHPNLEARRMETKMQSHGVSIEMPRIEVVDPVGLQKMLLSFRAETRPA
jgi:hypothetical protein